MDESSYNHGKTKLYYWGSLVLNENSLSNKKISNQTAVKKAKPSEILFDATTAPIVSMSAGKEHLALVSNDHKLYLLGNNSHGQVLPFGKAEPQDLQVPRPVSKSGVNYQVVQVSCGDSHTAFLTSLGRVFSFGGNSHGQLGHSEDRRQSFVAPRITQGTAHEILTMVSCGSLNTYVLTKQGKVFSSGCGENGRLGISRHSFLSGKIFLSDIVEDGNAGDMNEVTKNTFSFQEVKGLLQGVPVTKIEAGSAHCLALSITGKVFGWGSNVFGQLGFPIRDKKNAALRVEDDGVPQPVSISVDIVKSIVAGGHISVLVSNDNRTTTIYGASVCKPQKSSLTSDWGDMYKKNVEIVKASCRMGLVLLLMSDGNIIALGKLDRLSISVEPKAMEIDGIRFKVLNNLQAFEIGLSATNLYLLQSPNYKILGKHFQAEKELKLRKNMYSTFHASNLILEENQVFKYLRKFLCDMRSVNASFLLSNKDEIKALRLKVNKESEKTPMASSYVNVPLLLSFSKKITQAKFTTLEKLKVRQLAASLVAQLEFSANEAHEPDQLRAYFTLLVSPILSLMCENEYETIVVAIFKLPLHSRRRLFSWIYIDIVCRDTSLFIELLVKPVLKIVDTHVRRRKFTRQGVFLCKFLHCLHEISQFVSVESDTRNAKISFTSKGKIPSSTFYTAAFDEYTELSLQEMYKKWHAVVTEGGDTLTGSNVQMPFFGLFGAQILNNDEEIARPSNNETVPKEEKEDNQVFENDFGLQKFGTQFIKIVDNTLADTLGEISPDMVFFKHPFLLSANTKRRFMKIDDHYMHTRYVLQFFSQSINPHLILEIKRGKHMISETFQKLRQFRGKNEILLRRPLRIKFTGEDGLDAGGVKKEFFLLLSQDLFSPDFGYFTTIGSDSVIWFNNKIDQTTSKEQKSFFEYDEYLKYVDQFSKQADLLENMEIIGTLMGLAVYNDTLIDVQFPPTLYHLLLNNFTPDNLDINTYRQFDPKSADQLEYLMGIENEKELDELDMTFVLSQENYGSLTEVEICRNGQERKVSKDNLDEYIQKYIKFKMYSPLVELQAKCLRRGFAKLISAKHAALNLFNADELEMLLCGTPDLDFKVLQKICSYEGGYDEKHKTVLWFWQILNQFDFETRKKLLKFATGSSRAPIGGLKNIKFKLQRAGPDSVQLPTAHTCFNTLILPEYSSKSKLKRLLLLAIENSEGFGLQ